ncbi:MAG: HNH endonuclease [Dietzia sp.]
MTAWASNHRTRTRGVPRALAARIMHRDDHLCQIVGPTCAGDATAVDHIVPEAEGGTDDPDNLQAVCQPCHDLKTRAEAQRGRQRYGRRRPPPAHPADRWR